MDITYIPFEAFYKVYLELIHLTEANLSFRKEGSTTHQYDYVNSLEEKQPSKT